MSEAMHNFDEESTNVLHSIREWKRTELMKLDDIAIRYLRGQGMETTTANIDNAIATEPSMAEKETNIHEDYEKMIVVWSDDYLFNRLSMVEEGSHHPAVRNIVENHQQCTSDACQVVDDSCQCVVCMRKIEHVCTVLDCGHAFHYLCVIQTFTRAPTSRCPICRREVEISDIDHPQPPHQSAL